MNVRLFGPYPEPRPIVKPQVIVRAYRAAALGLSTLGLWRNWLQHT